MKTLKLSFSKAKKVIKKPEKSKIPENVELTPAKNVDILPVKPEIPLATEPSVLKPKRKFSFPISKKFLTIFFLFLLFAGGIAFAYYRISSYTVRVETFDEAGNKLDKCSNILNPECWTEAFRPQLKQTDGFTNILIIGMDTRDNGALMNTDSLIIASYNHTSNKAMMISIPRDFFSYRFKTKINAVLAYTHTRDSADKFRYLKEDIQAITGRQIHYVVTIKFKGVIDLVNNIGGIEICPYAKFTAKYPNPTVNKTTPAHWLYYDFAKGCQSVDGEKALVYARFRFLRSGPGELGSDFSRARRQQEIINAIKNKLLSQDLSLKERTENYWGLLQAIDANVTYTFTFEDFLAAIALLDKADTKPASVILDPMFGGWINRYIHAENKPGEGYTIKSGDANYTNIKNELNKIWASIDFYKDSPKIMIRNQTGLKELPKTHVVFTIKNNYNYWNQFNVINDPATTQFAGVKIFDFTAGAKSGSLELIKQIMGVDTVELLPETYGIARSNKNEDFLIVIGPTELPTPTVAPSVAETPVTTQ